MALLFREYWMSALVVSVAAVTAIGPESVRSAGLTASGATTKLSAKELLTAYAPLV